MGSGYLQVVHTRLHLSSRLVSASVPEGILLPATQRADPCSQLCNLILICAYGVNLATLWPGKWISCLCSLLRSIPQFPYRSTVPPAWLAFLPMLTLFVNELQLEFLLAIKNFNYGFAQTFAGKFSTEIQIVFHTNYAEKLRNRILFPFAGQLCWSGKLLLMLIKGFYAFHVSNYEYFNWFL